MLRGSQVPHLSDERGAGWGSKGVVALTADKPRKDVSLSREHTQRDVVSYFVGRFSALSCCGFREERWELEKEELRSCKLGGLWGISVSCFTFSSGECLNVSPLTKNRED